MPSRGCLKQVRAAVPFDWFLAAGRPFRGLGSDSGFLLACGCNDEGSRRLFPARLAEIRPAHPGAAQPAAGGDDGGDPRRRAGGRRRRCGGWRGWSAVGREVVAVPISYCGRDGGFVLFRRDQPFSPAEVEFLALVAPAIHGAAAERRAADLDDLTPRERECLTWASRGKTAGEIGAHPWHLRTYRGSPSQFRDGETQGLVAGARRRPGASSWTY